MTHIQHFLMALIFAILYLVADGFMNKAFSCDYQPEPETIEIVVVAG